MDIFQNPALVKAAIEEEKKAKDMAIASQDILTQVGYNARQSGGGIGNALGNLMGRPQPVDPRVAQVEQARQAVQGIDVTNPEGMMEAARKLNELGMTTEAIQLATKAQEGVRANMNAQATYNNSLPGQKDNRPTSQKEFEFYQKLKEISPSQAEVYRNMMGKKGVNVELSNIGNEAIPLTGAAESAAQKELFSIDDSISRLSDLEQQYQPEFLETFNKIDFWVDGQKEKLGIELSEAQTDQLGQFTDFKAAAAENMNRYIKFITGAQMSEKEAQRLLKAIPVPGNGLFDGDSPTQFKSKMNRQMRDLKASKLRYEFLLQNGIVIDGGEFTNSLSSKYSLGDFKKAMEAIDKGANPEDVMKHMKTEYKI